MLFLQWKTAAVIFVCLVVSPLLIETHSDPEEAEPSQHQQNEARKRIRLADREKFASFGAEFWYQNGITRLKQHFRDLTSAGFPAVNKNRRVRNLILVIGDGYGPVSITASRLYKEEFSKEAFYDNELVMDSFPFAGQTKTYNLDYVVSDSAGTATAYHSAAKTLYGHVGVDVTADLDCKNNDGFLSSIAHWAKAERKDAGFVTTTSVVHASPAPLYAHTPHRSHYTNDSDGMAKYPNCIDISHQFIENGRHLKVAMGGGEDYFIPNTMPSSFHSGRGRRIDGRNLIQEWIDDRSRGGLNAKRVANITQLDSISPKDVDYLLGIFSSGSLPYMDDGPKPSIPTLAQMAKKAIEVLDRNRNGYFLFIEGGKIDLGHHGGKARRALREAIEMDKALEQVVSMVDLSETLIVVSADHSHTMSLGGNFETGDSVLSISEERGFDLKNYTVLQYANGPGATLFGKRPDVTQEEAIARGYLQQALVPLDSETHGGEDVGVYASGPYSQLFTGVYEQSYIALAMACAGGLKKGVPATLASSIRDNCPEPWNAPVYDSSQMLLPGPVYNLLMSFLATLPLFRG